MKYDRRRAACEDCNTSAKNKKKADHSEDSESDIKASLRFSCKKIIQNLVREDSRRPLVIAESSATASFERRPLIQSTGTNITVAISEMQFKPPGILRNIYMVVWTIVMLL